MEQSSEHKHPLVEFFINRFKATTFFIIFLCVWGVASYLAMPQESDPEIIIPIGFVTTVYPGASPVDVEVLVTKEIEDELENLDEVKEITSSSRLGISTVIVEFEARADLDKSIQELKDAVDIAKQRLPDEAEDPFVSEVDFNDNPILTISLSGDIGETELQMRAKAFADEIEKVRGVKSVAIGGERETEWQVIIDPALLTFHDISYNTIIRQISTNNGNFPVGDLSVGTNVYTLRVDQTYKQIEDLKRLPLVRRDGGFIYLEDVAEMKEVLSEPSSFSSLYKPGNRDPKPSLTLTLRKQTRGDVPKIVDDVKERIKEIEDEGQILEGLTHEVVFDLAEFIRESLRDLQISGIQTIVIILLVLFLVLSARAAIITSVIIPLSFLMSFGILHLFDITLNGMTLFSLVLALGLLVDTAIVITEGMFENLKKGMPSKIAALASVKEFELPVISGVATTIAAFVPMLLVSGVVGQFLRTIPITVTVVLGSSLFLSLTVLPALGGHYFTHTNGEKTKRFNIFARLRAAKDRGLVWLQNTYRHRFYDILQSRRQSWIVMIASIVLLIITALFPVVGILEVGFFPRVDFPTIYINVKAPQGTRLEETRRMIGVVEENLFLLPELKNFVTTIGSSAGFNEPGRSGEHLAAIMVTLVDKEERDRKSFEIIDEYLRGAMDSITQLDVQIEDIASGPPTGAPIEVRITGPDLDELQRIVEEVKELVRSIPGTVDVSDDTDPGLSEFVFRLKRDKLVFYGLSAADTAGYLRTLIHGNTVGTVTVDGEDIDIVLKTNRVAAADITTLKRVDMVTARGPVALGNLADISFQSSLDVVNHKDLDRIIRVRSFVEGDASAQQIGISLEEQLKTYPLPDGYSMALGGETEDVTQSFTDLRNAMSVAVFLIFIILLLQFNSYKQTFLIILSVPFALIGVFIGLTIMRVPLDFPAFIGIVGLSGIAVNDAIILVSKVNRNLFPGGNPAKGLKIDDPIRGIVEGGADRIQPILVTTLTTVLGLLPITFVSEVWRSLGYAIIWGLIFATVLTLVIVPVQYMMWQRKMLGMRRTPSLTSAQ